MSTLSPNLDFVDKIIQCSAIEQVWELHVAKMAKYGFDRLIYAGNRFNRFGEFGDPSDSVVLTRHDKDYIEAFIGKSLYFHAPMAVWTTRNIGACSWQWVVDRRALGETTERENEILDFNEKMDVTAGYSISFEQISERSRSGIGLCAERGRSQADVDEQWAKVGDEITALNRVVNLKILSLPFEFQGKQLTNRQREVLQWVAEGKTMQDIAVILSLNQATVEKHLRKARERLNAETTAQAILKASIHNQFFIFDGVRNSS